MDCLFRKITSFLCLLLIWTGLSSAHAQIVDGIAAVVNEKVITFSEVKRLVDPTETQLRNLFHGVELMEKVKEARLTTLKSLIERALIVQRFDKDGFFIPDNIIEGRLKEVIDSQYDNDRNALIRTLHANGVSVASFKQELRDQMIVQAMRQRNVSSAVIVSPHKIEEYYQENLRQFTEPDQVKLRIIFLRNALFKEKRKDDAGKETEVDPQYNIAQELYKKIQMGGDFASLAKSYSEGAQRSNGGDLGWVSESSLRTELAKVAFKLKPGQFSELITTDDGYYILMVEDIKKATVLPLAQVREQIETTLLQEERERLQREWLDSLRAKAFIKMF